MICALQANTQNQLNGQLTIIQVLQQHWPSVDRLVGWHVCSMMTTTMEAIGGQRQRESCGENPTGERVCERYESQIGTPDISQLLWMGIFFDELHSYVMQTLIISIIIIVVVVVIVTIAIMPNSVCHFWPGGGSSGRPNDEGKLISFALSLCACGKNGHQSNNY